MRGGTGGIERPLPYTVLAKRVTTLEPESRVTTAVGALVVTHHPDAGLPSRLAAIATQVSRIVVVDNGSGARARDMFTDLQTDARFRIIRNERNHGVATALNQGMAALRQEGFSWAVTFDQDSRADKSLVPELVAALDSHPTPARVALIGANVIDTGLEGARRWVRPRKGSRWCFERVPCGRVDDRGVTVVITSGTMTNLRIAEELGGFREDLFIDLVDMEYALRAISAGFMITVCCAARLEHSVGDKQRRRLMGFSLFPTFHNPQRRYYLFRNRVLLFKKYAREFPYWVCYEFLAAINVILCIILFEDHKMDKLKGCLHGTWDGIRGKVGKLHSH